VQYNPEPPKKNNNKLMVVILIILCVLAVVALVGLVFVVAGGNNGKDDGNETEMTETQYVTVYHPETGEPKKINAQMLSEYVELGYSTEEPEIIDVPIYTDIVVLYRPNGETIEIPPEEAEEYLSIDDEEEKWYDEPVMYIYKFNGEEENEKKIIKESEVSDYTKTTEKDADGNEVEIPKEDRWYTAPVVMMYAPKDRYVIINADEQYVQEYIDNGWHTEPVAAVKKNGEQKVVKLTELDKYISEGWTEFDPKVQPCDYCGSKDHKTEEHPRCQYCNSTKHTSAKHPKCSVCGSRSHNDSYHDKKEETKPTVVTPEPAKCSYCGSTAHTSEGHPKCAYCGSTSHTSDGHPKCSYCGSTSHTTHPKCATCGSLDHTTHPMCDYCDSTTHTSLGHPTCSWCGRRDHTGAEHDAVIAAEAANG